MSIIGFTGTRNGITKDQERRIVQLAILLEIHEFHHGDCIGSDIKAHKVIKKLNANIKIIIHPPSYTGCRAYCRGNIILTPLPYLDRNRDIVDSSDILIATPDTKERVRSGTWSTVRYARRKGKEVIIINPNGEIT